jgi:membrane protein implicated in regulation of membrane protease activity
MGVVNAWVWWLAGAAVLGIPLVITAMPEFGMFAIGAVGASLASALGAGGVLQVVIFLVVSVALVSVVRTIAARHKTTRPELRTNVDALKGRQALVLERVDGRSGRVKLGGEIWSARSYDAALVFEAGQEVDVVEIEGATAVVM